VGGPGVKNVIIKLYYFRASQPGALDYFMEGEEP
jgi:hypothetical protein